MATDFIRTVPNLLNQSFSYFVRRLLEGTVKMNPKQQVIEQGYRHHCEEYNFFSDGKLHWSFQGYRQRKLRIDQHSVTAWRLMLRICPEITSTFQLTLSEKAGATRAFADHGSRTTDRGLNDASRPQ